MGGNRYGRCSLVLLRHGKCWQGEGDIAKLAVSNIRWMWQQDVDVVHIFCYFLRTLKTDDMVVLADGDWISVWQQLASFSKRKKKSLKGLNSIFFN